MGIDSFSSSGPSRLPLFSWRTDLALVAISTFLFLILFRNIPLRVGDGSEYYGLYLAIKNHHVPWMTAGAYVDYSQLQASGQIQGLVTGEFLRDSFPALRRGDTADFNHFWFYSLPPALLASVLELSGIQIPVQSAFLAWHALLLFLPMRLAYRAHGTLGVVVVIALTVCSPIIWFSDKVHTEFFTYSLALCTFILVSQKRLVAASCCMAIASTQNPSFAIISLVLLLMRASLLRVNRPVPREVFGAIATCLIVLVHPLYYFARFGVPTPQLLAGGAKIGGHFSDSYVWFFDPDVGLLPNWPLGLLIAVAMIFCITKIRRRDWLSMGSFFIAAYLLINLFAQSSTINLNSGATPGLARYALWYIPVFYPFAIYFGELLRAKANFYLTASVLMALAVYFGANAYIYDPRQPESYASPSPFSKFLQTYLPSLYDPPSEIFLERFSGTGESAATHALSAVVGPSCDKVLIFPNRDPRLYSIPDHCMLMKDAILREVAEAGRKSSEPRYIRISTKGSPSDLRGTGSYFFRNGDSGLGLLGEGWHKAESWGIWSKAPAQLSIPCAPGEARDFGLELTLRPFVSSQYPSTPLRIASGRQVFYEGSVAEYVQNISILIPRDLCDARNRATITIAPGRFHSPKELALSDDDRPLGIGLEKIHYPDR
ncbi:MAG: hypothetical protein EOP24_29245 [Hyphomicrobiales bacterium]|nr:MAG: hypothetical protein EOP24_29245 [Hyphomicrobiales bacterium]